MYDDIKVLLEKYNNNKQYLNEDFINNVCEIIRDNRKVNKFINNWSFDSNLKAFGEYNPNDFSMCFNLQYNGCIQATKIHPDYQYLFYNIEVLIGIFHEFVHVEQTKKMNELFNSKNIYQELKQSNNLLEASILYLSSNNINNFNNILIYKLIKKLQFFYYCHNHDKDPTEREADIKSSKEAKQVVDRMEIKKEIELLKNYIYLIKSIDYLNGYKLHGKTTNNQCINYFKHKPFFPSKEYLMKALPIFKDLNIPFDTRLLYGLTLTDSEFIALKINCSEAGKEFKKSLLDN